MPDDAQSADQSATLHSIGEYYSATQLRTDRWSALREVVDALSRLGPDDPAAVKFSNRAKQLFEALSPIEMYWAFPGLAAFDNLRRQLEHRNWEDLAFSVRRVLRALTTGAYRRRTIPLAGGEADADDIEDEATLPIEARALARPYFEVLLVDVLGEHQERWLRSSLTRMRRPEDSFVYESVVVPSLEDALIAILFNHNIQAIVVRPGLALKWSSNLLTTSFQSSASFGGSPLRVMFGQLSAYFVFISTHFSAPSSVSGWIASTGHSGSQTPQSIHSSG